MYCVKCGVQMDDGTIKCPLCGTLHTFISGEPIAAAETAEPKPRLSRDGVFIIITAASLLLIATALAIDLTVNRHLTWAGYIAGGVLLLYMVTAFPLWLRNADKLVIVAAEYAATALYLLALEQTIGGGWYLPVGLPIVLFMCLLTLTLMLIWRRHPSRGLAIAGLAWISLGLTALVLELLINRFIGAEVAVWSPWVLLGCAVVGGALLVIAFCEPLRERIIKRMFI